MVNVQLDKKDGGNTHTYSSEVPACRQTYEKKVEICTLITQVNLL